ncbi:MAG: hypothetical protein V8T87_01490, partial [Victivallales bacterium]
TATDSPILVMSNVSAELHPEYFALRKDGRRYSDPKMPHPGQLCLSNPGIRNEIFLDVRSYLKGENAAVRGIKGPGNGSSYWASPGFQPGFANLMPQDAFQPCNCKECQKYFDKGNLGGSNLVWEMTAEIANRIKAEKIPGYLTQMAYHFYSIVPDVEVPDNVSSWSPPPDRGATANLSRQAMTGKSRHGLKSSGIRSLSGITASTTANGEKTTGIPVCRTPHRKP